jgi:hypothetical protein
VQAFSLDKDIVVGYVKDVLLDSELSAKLEEIKNQIEMQYSNILENRGKQEVQPVQPGSVSPTTPHNQEVSVPSLERDTEKEAVS